MKTILLLLLTCLPLCAATTYPMLSTTTNRTVTGGVTNMSLLNANQTFTGTNTFPAAGLFKPNFISRRMLFITNNVFISSVITNAVDQTNNGGYANGSAVLIATMPPLLGSNSVVVFGYQVIRTNANTGTTFVEIYCGNQTNWTASLTVGANSIGKSLNTGTSTVVKNANSMTNQVLLPSVALNQHMVPTNSFDSTASWSVYISAQTASSFTNLWFESIWFEEIVIP